MAAGKPSEPEGISRSLFVVSVISMWVIQMLLMLFLNWALKAGSSSSADSKVVLIFCRFVTIVFFYGLHLVFSYYRFQNMGLNPWRTFELLIPVWSLILLVFCTAAQTDYAQTRRLDTVGRQIVLIASAVSLALTALLMMLVMPR